MAYLSRAFGQTEDDRKRVQGGVAGADAAPMGAASPAPTPTIDRNPVQSFFAANKDQGGSVLSSLADSLSSKISGANQQLETSAVAHQYDPVYSQGRYAPGRLVGYSDNGRVLGYGDAGAVQGILDRSKSNHDETLKAAQDAASQNTALVQPVKEQVGQLGSQEGMQTLLAQDRTGYTGGQSGLDAWLGASAVPQGQARLDQVKSGLSALESNAGFYDPRTEKRKNVEDYLNGR